MATSPPRLSTGLPPVDPPPVDHIDGRPVAWHAWAPNGLPGRHLPPCDGCGYSGVQWRAYGAVEPLEGELFATPGGRLAKAWPILRLVAHHCPACRHRRVFDIRGGGWVPVPIDLTQPSLFPDLPAQRARRATKWTM